MKISLPKAGTKPSDSLISGFLLTSGPVIWICLVALGAQSPSAFAMFTTETRRPGLTNSLDRVPCDTNVGLPVANESDLEALDHALEEPVSVGRHFQELKERTKLIANASSSYYTGGNVNQQQLELCQLLELKGRLCQSSSIVQKVEALRHEKDHESLIRKYEDWLALHRFYTERNRYGNVQAPEHSRVRLQKREDYFNGNYVDPEARLAGDELQIDPTSQSPKYKTEPKKDVFIATQAPKRETQGDFWDMVYEQKVPVIVNMTSAAENAEKKKTISYWPTSETPTRFGQSEVSLEKVKVSGDFILRTFKIRRGDETPREVVMIHDPRWPDGNVLPKAQVEELEARVNATKKKLPPGPVVVHCSAGVGRTGALIGTMRIKKDPQAFKTAKDVDNMVLSMRAQRSGEKDAPMVQTEVQLKLLYEMAGLHTVE